MTEIASSQQPSVQTGTVRGGAAPVAARDAACVTAKVHVVLQGQEETLEALTISVNPHGALVLMKRGLPQETRLILENAGTRQRMGCRVVRAAREMAEGWLSSGTSNSIRPAPDFWKIPTFRPLTGVRTADGASSSVPRRYEYCLSERNW